MSERNVHVALTLTPDDWLDQKELAALLRVSPKTISLWAKRGRLAIYEHGVANCGRRRYSRALVERDLQRRWEEAVRRQDEPGS